VTWYNRDWPALPPTKKTHRPDVGAIVTSYNTLELLRECLRSLRAQVGVEGLVAWVVDSASRDGSPAMVRAEFPEVRLIAMPTNVLYVRLNNVGLRDLMTAEPRPRNVLLLNGDTELPSGALAHLLGVLDEYPDVGAVGPRLALPTGEIDWACRRGFPSPGASFFHMSGLARLFPRSRLFGRYRLTFLDERAMADVDSIVGAFMLVRTEVLEQVGFFDETFQMYGEDLDLARRIRASGWRVVYDGRIDVLHHKRASSKQNPRTRVHFWHAMQVFFRKHYAEATPKPLRLLIECAIGLAWAVTAMRLRREAVG
jgi:N-acetylglucosaminyl-diphospho-decaprenol L-rhamnosyltransferase